MPAAPQPELPTGRQLIQGYGPGRFTIAGTAWQGSVLVLPGRTTSWPPASLAELDIDSFAALRTVEPALEILVVGTGSRFELLPPPLRQAIRALGPVVEAMATPAACRTYNVLLAEGRLVAAALLAMPSEP